LTKSLKEPKCLESDRRAGVKSDAASGGGGHGTCTRRATDGKPCPALCDPQALIEGPDAEPRRGLLRIDSAPQLGLWTRRRGVNGRESLPLQPSTRQFNHGGECVEPDQFRISPPRPYNSIFTGTPGPRRDRVKSPRDRVPAFAGPHDLCGRAAASSGIFAASSILA
jgi:hypothetical protein